MKTFYYLERLLVTFAFKEPAGRERKPIATEQENYRWDTLEREGEAPFERAAGVARAKSNPLRGIVST